MPKRSTTSEKNNWTTIPVKPVVGEELTRMAKSEGRYVSRIVFDALKTAYPERFTDEMIKL